MGVDGIIAVAAGAGGHTGSVSPFALTQEIREWWRGPLLLAGCIATGRAILAAETLGADFAYIGSPFLASAEANTAAAFKQMVVESGSADVIVTTRLHRRARLLPCAVVAGQWARPRGDRAQGP